jgi:regulator of protease activity HflC (stomatin/prohibitin superfamily)
MQSCERISPTEAGFKISNSGNYRGIDSLPLLTGWQFYTPGFNYVVTIPTIMQHEVWTDTKEGQEGMNAITIACQGGAGFRVDVGLNYHVDATKASHIYLKWRNDDLESITNQYIKNIVRGCMQDVSGHITVDSILTNLPAYEHEVASNITKKLGIDGFIVDGFNITSQPRPTDNNLAASINAKVKAKQDAETSIMQLQMSVAEAKKKIANARGDSASAVITAAGEAAAIRLKQQVVTSAYIEYVKACRWNGKLPDVMTGSGGTMLNVTTK